MAGSGDDSLCLKCEDGNEHQRYSSHVRKKLRTFNLFLTLPNFAIKCKVAGKQINRGAGYGLKIPVH